MMDSDLLVEQIAEYYNVRALPDPTNAPSVRELAARFKIGTTTAAKYRDRAWDRGLLCFPPRRRPRQSQAGAA